MPSTVWVILDCNHMKKMNLQFLGSVGVGDVEFCIECKTKKSIKKILGA